MTEYWDYPQSFRIKARSWKEAIAKIAEMQKIAERRE